MTNTKHQIGNGIYVVIDPSMEEPVLLEKLEQVVKEKIVAVQLWDNFQAGQDIAGSIRHICRLCHSKRVPVLINNRWEYLLTTDLDGVHFDEIPQNLLEITHKVGRGFLRGLTCNNDLEPVRWANRNNFDYVSFCSVFPSSTSNSCELVTFETIKEAIEISSIPIFLAGGIRPENIANLDGLGYSGIAVISGVMSAENPGEAIRKYQSKLKMNQYED